MLTLLLLLVGLICIVNLIVVSVILSKPVQPDIYLSPTINTMSNPLADSLKGIMGKALNHTLEEEHIKTRRRRKELMSA